MGKIAKVSAGLSLLLIFIFALAIPEGAMATFSIVAVDPATGIVGGAGASCIAGSQMIDDIIAGVGAVHTQAYYLAQNQANAHTLLAAGATPDSIIHWLENNDVEGTPYFRQYGVVTLAGPGASAAYTGSSNSQWAGHLTGFGYSIQGNILLGPEIVDSMEAAFLRTTGPMEDRLMAALVAANVPGADTRCYSCNKPAISAFIKVVHPGDGTTPYLYEVVNNTICAKNPIDSLVVRYNLWKSLSYADPNVSTVTVDHLELPASGEDSALITVRPLNYTGQPPREGCTVAMIHSGGGTLSTVIDNGDGTYSATLIGPTTFGTDTVKVSVTAGGQVSDLNQKPVVRYYLCGDANGNNAVNVLDATFLISWIYKNGPAPNPVWLGDPNANGAINVLDVSYMIVYLYKSGAAPVCPHI